MHDVHRVSRLRIAQGEQISLNIRGRDLVDLVSRAARGERRKRCRIDRRTEQIGQRKGVGRRVGHNVIAVIQLRHATDAGDVDLFAVAEAVRVGRDHTRVGLRHSSDRLGRAGQNLQAIAVHPHGLWPKLQDVGVAGLELKRDQASLGCAVLNLSKELSAWPAGHTTVRHDHHVRQI